MTTFLEDLDVNGYKKLFNIEVPTSFATAQQVANHWFKFSDFIPSYLSRITNYIDDDQIKARFDEIISEELGCDGSNTKHSVLYEKAVESIGLEIKKSNSSSITSFEKKSLNLIAKEEDPESFAVGLSFGLEIIAEENILLLLRASLPSIELKPILEKSIFFKIHMKNELAHIEKCLANLEILKIQNRLRPFMEGYQLSRKFWGEFWCEALSV